MDTYSSSPAIQELEELRAEYGQVVTLLEERGKALRAEAIVMMSSRLWWGVVARAERA